ncbi:hypothetical protein Lfu02_44200 [Longispora fulva]|uniref:Putative membrane protein SirB2 n=1 Tax=Longispora fulva TaxID=619741 RepID=A0A8J7KWR9_9ACTN|nr:hypothetical protein [Longispora fulva]MBG6136877.1 putative membrane protein SirB2 [Longispora fulva]GIG60048.1 hypothetical protein Lfu02_44200 [Longispora fulva]
MAVAALITWLVTAVLGVSMLGMWLAGGGVRAAGGTPTRLVPPLIFGHFLLAASGLVVWIIYLIVDKDALTWVAFGLLVLVATLGDVMFLRWRRSRAQSTPEARFPVALVYGHGLFAVTTVVLVLLTALGVGE